jgi:hypothetical protein
VTETSTEGSFSQIIVHYNTLGRSLLVNRLPLTRLPRDYQLHITYRLLFGEVRTYYLQDERDGADLVNCLESSGGHPLNDDRDGFRDAEGGLAAIDTAHSIPLPYTVLAVVKNCK